jgi:putative transposase
MHIEPLTTLKWAFQLHYYLCFRTRRLRPVFSNSDRVDLLSSTVSEICQRHDFHLLETKVFQDHLRLLVSLRPTDAISKVVQTIKANSARATASELGLEAPIWGRGYLARSIGRISISAVKRYIDDQAEHHGYAQRPLTPVFRFRADRPVALSTPHASFELNHHVVFATRRRMGIFGSALGKALIAYWIRVADKHGFAIDRCTVVPDHVHLLVRTTPKLSVEECALSLLNNGQHFVGRHAPELLVQAGINQLWQSSAYAGTCGEFNTALMKSFLRKP